MKFLKLFKIFLFLDELNGLNYLIKETLLKKKIAIGNEENLKKTYFVNYIMYENFKV